MKQIYIEFKQEKYKKHTGLYFNFYNSFWKHLSSDCDLNKNKNNYDITLGDEILHEVTFFWLLRLILKQTFEVL